MKSTDASTTGKRKPARRKRKAAAGESELQIVHPDAAGIDIGNEVHYVSVPEGRSPQPVQTFGCFTGELERMARWLKQCGIRTVAMQSTGVYWMPVYDVLEAHGLEVYLVNARHTKSLPGRKTDVQECLWLRRLHGYGLLANSFHPPDEIRTLRAYWRQRKEHIAGMTQQILRMQKILTQMNIQLSNVISDLSGVTGQRILRAILAGERDPLVLARLKHPSIRSSEEQIVRSLQGNWRPELLFLLKQQMEHYDHYQRQIRECDEQIERHMAQLQTRTTAPQAAAAQPSAPAARRRTRGPHAPGFDIEQHLHRVTGVDLTRIDGISVDTAQTLLCELGADMSRWKTEAHFVSYLGLCPDNRISGGKVLGRGTRRVPCRAATALRLAASSLLRSQSYLGAQYRRLRTRLGAPKAITAMAHRLARLVYRMLRYGEEYVDRGAEYYEAKYRSQQLQHLHRKAAQLGFQLIENANPC